jgi:hypothetical protein
MSNSAKSLIPVETLIKQANTKMLQCAQEDYPDVTWDDIVENIPPKEYQAFLSGYLMAMDAFLNDMDCSFETNKVYI